MAFNGVPWMVGGGSSGPLHNADLGRLVLYLATQGFQGVLSPLDFVPSALSTPDHYINISPGAGVWICKAPGTFAQSYGDYMSSQYTLELTPNITASTRSDLVVARIDDIYADPSADPPADQQTGPYAGFKIYPNVDPGTTSIEQIAPSATAFDICRIDWPANTSAVTNSYIKDLRQVIDIDGQKIGGLFVEKIWTDIKPTGITDDNLLESQSTYKDWPVAASWQLPIPNTASYADISARVFNADQTLGPCWGQARMVLSTTSPAMTVYTQEVEFVQVYWGAGVPTSLIIPAGGRVSIPAAMRGKVATLKMQAKQQVDAATTGTVTANRGTQVEVWVNFKRLPVLS